MRPMKRTLNKAVISKLKETFLRNAREGKGGTWWTRPTRSLDSSEQFST